MIECPSLLRSARQQYQLPGFGWLTTLPAVATMGTPTMPCPLTDPETSPICRHDRPFWVCLSTAEVPAGAPLVISDDLIKTFNISIVARGTVSETGHSGNGEERRYATPKQQGILRYSVHIFPSSAYDQSGRIVCSLCNIMLKSSRCWCRCCRVLQCCAARRVDMSCTASMMRSDRQS